MFREPSTSEVQLRWFLLVIHRRATQDTETGDHWSAPWGDYVVEKPRLAVYWSRFKVTNLCGAESLTKYCVLALVFLQLISAIGLQHVPIFSLRFFLTAYVVGATANQALFLAIHEISHNLAFKSSLANRLLAIFANLPIGIPYSAAFRVRTFALAKCPFWIKLTNLTAIPPNPP